MSMTIGLEREHPVIDIIMKLARLPGFISTILGIAVLVWLMLNSHFSMNIYKINGSSLFVMGELESEILCIFSPMW